MLCILYVNVFGAFFGVIGLLTQRVIPASSSRRWLWCAIIVASTVIPGYSRTHHAASVMAAFEQKSPTVSWMNPAWFVRAEAQNHLIGWFSLVVSSMLLLWGLATFARVAMLLWSARRGESGNRVVVDGVPAVITKSLGPATVGLIRSRVVLPRWVLALPGAQRQYVVRHEEEHRRAHDSQLLFFMSILLLLAPWSLALWWQLRRLRLAVEMDCDNRVVSALGNRHEYGQLLFRVAEASSRGPQLQPAFLGGGMLEQRLTALLQPSQLRSFQKFLLPALAVALLFVAIRMPHPVMGNSSHAHSSMQAKQ